MSNDVIVAIKQNPALLQTGVDDDTRAVAGSGGGKRISIKGGVFRKMAGGQEIASVEDRHMNIIFVKMAHNPSRTYYERAYKEGTKTAPKCWSSDAKVPDEDVKEPLGESCDKCPMSVKGTGQNGQGTACRLAWRTAVVLPSDPGGDVMQLVLPAASVFGKEEAGRWPFRAYVQMLANNNISAGRVVTKMSFDTKASAPRVLFNPVSGVEMDDIETLQRQSASVAAEQAVKLTVFQQDEGEDADDSPAPAAPETGVKAQEESGEEVSEPKLRSKATEAEGEEPKDVSDIVKKWSRKK